MEVLKYISITLLYYSIYVINTIDGTYIERQYKEAASEGPLYLTPYIESEQIKEARNAAKVESFVPGRPVVSYAGLLTVNKVYNSNLFFWFFQSETNWIKSPITIWLQGGPGYSGLYGLFNELGPYYIENAKIQRRKYSWHRKSNLIFIDSPVGTGYSFTEDINGYARNQTVIGIDLFNAVVQILKLFPEIQNNEFYISGESYAGKYIPTLGYAIHTMNSKSDVKVNLKGLFIGNGLTDPVNMISGYANQLYSLGLIDYNQKILFENRQKRLIEEINEENWEKATLLYTKLIIGYSFFPFKTLFTNMTGLDGYYNYVNLNSAKWENYEEDFVTSDYFKNSVHVGSISRSNGSLTEKLLKEDITKSVINLVETLVEHYRVSFYNGQLDVICAYPLTEGFLRKMKWSGAEEYRNASRRKWFVGKELAGYVKTTRTLSDVLVRNAGHMVPTDQPKWAFDLFNKFIYNIEL